MTNLVSLPLARERARSKPIPLNLNHYRNAHYQTLNQTKVWFKDYMKNQIMCLPDFKRIKVTYTLFPKTKRLCDISNVCSIIDKYFMDALVEFGKLEDDNYMFVPEITYKFGSVDKDNPRCEALIEEL